MIVIWGAPPVSGKLGEDGGGVSRGRGSVARWGALASGGDWDAVCVDECVCAYSVLLAESGTDACGAWPRNANLALTRVRGIPREWFGPSKAPAEIALTFEYELGHTFNPTIFGPRFATEAADCIRIQASNVLRKSYVVLGHPCLQRTLAARRRTVRRQT